MEDMLQAGMADDGANGILRAILPDGQVHNFSNLNHYSFMDRIPLLYHAFQYGYQSRPEAELEVPSEGAVTIMIGYGRTGLYPLDPPSTLEPVLLLPHAQTYNLAENLDVKELQTYAYSAFNIITMRAISLPGPPADLANTIRFVYEHYSNAQSYEQHELVKILANYCVTALLPQGLNRDPEFIQVVKDTPLFHRDLCKVSAERGFAEDCAQAIVLLALDAPPVRSEPNPTTLASRDLPDVMYVDKATLAKQDDSEDGTDLSLADEGIFLADTTTTVQPSVKTEGSVCGSDTEDAEKTVVTLSDTEDDEKTAVAYASESEDGFCVVLRSKLKLHDSTPPNEPMSSPEVVAVSDGGHMSDDVDDDDFTWV